MNMAAATRDIPSTQPLQELRWLPIEKRICFKIEVMVYKPLKEAAPCYITDLLTLYKLFRTLRWESGYTADGQSADGQSADGL